VDRRSEVRDFYEKMPYPAPVESLDRNLRLYANPDYRRALYHLIWPAGQSRANQEILIAGCGTSQAARYALREPDANVTGIDISETSIDHTSKLQRRYNLKNLELHQMPIEHVAELGRSFDLIVSTGVLHHLPDPVLGLRTLRDVLDPEGAMHLMVYARYGRAGIYMMQEYCRLLGIGTSEKDFRDLACTLNALPPNHPVSGLLKGAKDFQQPDAMADALLHPQDRAYTVPELYSWLQDCGMSFGRWYEQAPYLPQCGVIAKTPHGERMGMLSEPAQHAAAELFRGTITQHNFVAYRNDRSTVPQPIHFGDQLWRNWIPIRLPWTICVRERCPPGSVAVLLNPAHKHPDLVLPIESSEAHLLDQIDGTRTLETILQCCRKNEDAVRGLSFFQKLWRYDQIVLDASGAETRENVQS
jgi:SAM-dependent methyltransferase